MVQPVFRKSQIEAFALEYARRVLREQCPSGPTELDNLTRTAQWANGTPKQRSDICIAITARARNLLIQNGYSREFVYQRI